MTTKQIAEKLIEYCSKGDFDTAVNELYSDDIVSVEPDHAPGPSRTGGMEAKRQKDKMFDSMIEEVHSNTISDLSISGKHFSLKMQMDATFKDGSRMNAPEICIYRVNDEGKINYEEFFYDEGT
jgi:hypothetical protein